MVLGLGLLLKGWSGKCQSGCQGSSGDNAMIESGMFKALDRLLPGITFVMDVMANIRV